MKNWRKLYFKIYKNKREEILVGSGIGEDNAIIDFGEEVCIMSTDPITGATKGIGKLAIYISCNDVASSGGRTYRSFVNHISTA